MRESGMLVHGVGEIRSGGLGEEQQPKDWLVTKVMIKYAVIQVP